MILFDKALDEADRKSFAGFLDAVRSGEFAKALAGEDGALNEGGFGPWWDMLSQADKELIRKGDVSGISNRADYERYCDWLYRKELFPDGAVRKADQDDEEPSRRNRYFRNGRRDLGQDLTKDGVHSVAAAIVKNWDAIATAAEAGLGELIKGFEHVLKAEGVDRQPAAQKYMQLARRQLNKNMVLSLIAGIVYLGSNRYNVRLRAYDKDPEFKHRGEKYVAENKEKTEMTRINESSRENAIGVALYIINNRSEALDKIAEALKRFNIRPTDIVKIGVGIQDAPTHLEQVDALIIQTIKDGRTKTYLADNDRYGTQQLCLGRITNHLQFPNFQDAVAFLKKNYHVNSVAVAYEEIKFTMPLLSESAGAVSVSAELIDEIYYKGVLELNHKYPALDDGRANNSIAYALEKDSVNDLIEEYAVHPNDRLFTNLMDEVIMVSEDYLSSHGYI